MARCAIIGRKSSKYKSEVTIVKPLFRRHLASIFLFQELSKISASFLKLVTLTKMTFDFGKMNELVIVTGASSTHQRSLLQLITSISIYEKEAQVHIFDLGMESEFREKVSQFCLEQKFNLHTYDFSQKPAWMDVKNPQKGEWAWKADCLNRIAGLLIGEDIIRANTSILWLDAGNKLIANLNLVNRYIQNYLFWSPASEGTIEKWTVQAQIDQIIGSNKYNSKRNLNGAMVGFSLESPKSLDLLKNWEELSAKKDIIAPEGSSRANHRQDQSLITLLAYKVGLATKKQALNLQRGSLLQHQDIDSER